MLSPCNVYGTGTILLAMIELRLLGFSQPSFIPGQPPAPYEVSRSDPLFRQIYSAELCQLVDQCLSIDPRDRPTVESLKTLIDARLWSGDWAYDRNGYIGAEDDTLLVPGHPVLLKWASRMNGDPDAPRTAREPESEHEPDSEDGDTEMGGV